MYKEKISAAYNVLDAETEEQSPIYDRALMRKSNDV